MKNIDRIKYMSIGDFISFLKEGMCERCLYNTSHCNENMCEEGVLKWLEEEDRLTIKDIHKEMKLHCEKEFSSHRKNESCIECEYNPKTCGIEFAVKNFNVIDGKITKREYK